MTMRRNLINLGAATLMTVAAMGPARASTQGSLGSTSTGSVSISASIPSRVRISGLSDVAFTNADPTIDAANAQNVCVWSNTGTKGYQLTATGSGSSNAFTLANASLTVPYTVEWNGSSGQTSGTALATGTASASLISTATHQTCTAGPSSSASLIVGMSTTDLQSMEAGLNYTGSLTLLVTPQ